MQADCGCRWALAVLVVVASLACARLLQGTAVGASLNARMYAVVHAFAQVTDAHCLLQSQHVDAGTSLRCLATQEGRSMTIASLGGTRAPCYDACGRRVVLGSTARIWCCSIVGA